MFCKIYNILKLQGVNLLTSVFNKSGRILLFLSFIFLFNQNVFATNILDLIRSYSLCKTAEDVKAYFNLIGEELKRRNLPLTRAESEALLEAVNKNPIKIRKCGVSGTVAIVIDNLKKGIPEIQAIILGEAEYQALIAGKLTEGYTPRLIPGGQPGHSLPVSADVAPGLAKDYPNAIQPGKPGAVMDTVANLQKATGELKELINGSNLDSYANKQCDAHHEKLLREATDNIQCKMEEVTARHKHLAAQYEKIAAELQHGVSNTRRVEIFKTLTAIQRQLLLAQQALMSLSSKVYSLISKMPCPKFSAIFKVFRLRIGSPSSLDASGRITGGSGTLKYLGRALFILGALIATVDSIEQGTYIPLYHFLNPLELLDVGSTFADGESSCIGKLMVNQTTPEEMQNCYIIRSNLDQAYRDFFKKANLPNGCGLGKQVNENDLNAIREQKRAFFNFYSKLSLENRMCFSEDFSDNQLYGLDHCVARVGESFLTLMQQCNFAQPLNRIQNICLLADSINRCNQCCDGELLDQDGKAECRTQCEKLSISTGGVSCSVSDQFERMLLMSNSADTVSNFCYNNPSNNSFYGNYCSHWSTYVTAQDKQPVCEANCRSAAWSLCNHKSRIMDAIKAGPEEDNKLKHSLMTGIQCARDGSTDGTTCRDCCGAKLRDEISKTRCSISCEDTGKSGVSNISCAGQDIDKGFEGNPNQININGNSIDDGFNNRAEEGRYEPIDEGFSENNSCSLFPRELHSEEVAPVDGNLEIFK